MSNTATAMRIKRVIKRGLRHLKPEWGMPLRIYDAPGDGRPVLIAAYHHNGGWKLERDALASLHADLREDFDDVTSLFISDTEDVDLQLDCIGGMKPLKSTITC